MRVDWKADDPTLDLPWAYGRPVGQGQIRISPEDFQVEEELGYGPEGAGEHVFIRLRKRGLNTQEVIKRLASCADIAIRDVGYAGLKDRQAVTTQSFTVGLAGKPEPDWSILEGDEIKLLEVARHRRKIRRGSLRGNRFKIRIRDWRGDGEAFEERMRHLQSRGVPNFFGSQRFGRQGSNLERAEAFFAKRLRIKRPQRAMLYSAVRSYLFNLVLAERVKQGAWDRPLDGEIMLLGESSRQFAVESPDDEIIQRVGSAEIHPTGPLAGKPGRSLQPTATVAELEQNILIDESFWVDGLVENGLEQDRRSLRVMVKELDYQVGKEELLLSFRLTAGSYATVVLREVVNLIP